MKKITFDNPHRQKHFEFFNAMNHPHFNITAPVDVTALISRTKAEGISTNLAIVHALSTAANQVKELRRRIRDNEVVEHDVVHPSYTVETADTDVFSFCTVRYFEDRPTFITEAQEVQQQMKTNPSMEDDPDRDDYLFLAAFPWVAFTAYQHAMQYHPHDSVPRISWGKIYPQDHRSMMPLSIQVHHAVVDGRHVGAFFENVEKITK